MGTYLCASWQGLIQEVVKRIGNGYFHVCVTYFPEKKKERWIRIDEKIQNKYGINYKNKWVVARRKKKGLANFSYLRWEHVAVIQHTSGELDDGLKIDDPFVDATQKPVRLQISGLVSFDIYLWAGHFTVRLSPETYRGIKDSLGAMVSSGQKKYMVVKAFDRLNGFPAWRGIIVQKRQLAKYLVNQARKHHVNLTMSDLRIVDKRHPVKVFEDETIKK